MSANSSMLHRAGYVSPRRGYSSLKQQWYKGRRCVHQTTTIITTASNNQQSSLQLRFHINLPSLYYNHSNTNQTSSKCSSPPSSLPPFLPLPLASPPFPLLLQRSPSASSTTRPVST